MTSEQLPESKDSAIEATGLGIETVGPWAGKRIFQKFFLAALSSIPWVGGFIAAAASLKADEADIRQDNLQTQWIQEHQRKIRQLRQTLSDIASRFQTLGETIDDRIQSEEYLTLVRRAFRAWDRADTEEKRKYVANLVSNSAGSRICSDDVVRLFIDWLDLYHEVHFAVIREIYRKPRSTRFEIWSTLYGTLPREVSAEADLFRLLIRDLSTGGVIRQERETNWTGEFVRQPRTTGKKRGDVLESSFEPTKPYVLTALGNQFVHYTMNELVPRLED